MTLNHLFIALFGFKLKKPDFKIRSITKDEFQRLISTPCRIQKSLFYP